MNKILKIILLVALGAFVLMQFIRPEKNKSGYESVAFFETETKPSVEIAALLKTHCYDCHSDHTIYPWYAEIAPASYWLKDHIDDGKKHFNVSAWESYSAKKKDHKLDELIEFVEDGEMPLESYTWLHGDLPKEDVDKLIQWVQVLRLRYQKEIAELAK